jgi:alpha-glucosidase (family GH31 glycosyl hydrolase)
VWKLGGDKGDDNDGDVDLMTEEERVSYVLTFARRRFWQCKLRYRNQTELQDIADGYVSRSLPLSVIVIDFYHWVHFGDWSFNKNCWPDQDAMVAHMDERGVQIMVSVWPFLDEAGSHFPAFKSQGLLVTNASGHPEMFHAGQQVSLLLCACQRHSSGPCMLRGW